MRWEQTSAPRDHCTTRCRPPRRACPNPVFLLTHGFARARRVKGDRGLKVPPARGGLKCPGSPSRAQPWGLGVGEDTLEKPAVAGVPQGGIAHGLP